MLNRILIYTIVAFLVGILSFTLVSFLRGNPFNEFAPYYFGGSVGALGGLVSGFLAHRIRYQYPVLAVIFGAVAGGVSYALG